MVNKLQLLYSVKCYGLSIWGDQSPYLGGLKTGSSLRNQVYQGSLGFQDQTSVGFWQVKRALPALLSTQSSQCCDEVF